MVTPEQHNAVASMVAKSVVVLSALLCCAVLASRCFALCREAQRRALDREDRGDPCYRFRKRIRYAPLSTVALQS